MIKSMKKIFVALFTASLMFSLQAKERQSYEVDPGTTANASWKVGERVVDDAKCHLDPHLSDRCYTVFLGMTKKGNVLIQDFYDSGERFTDSHEVMSIDAAKESLDRRIGFFWNELSLIDGLIKTYARDGYKNNEATFLDGYATGAMINWYKNGQKSYEYNYQRGWRYGVQRNWHMNGQKYYEGSAERNEPVGIWRWWDKDGNLIDEKDYGYPERPSY